MAVALLCAFFPIQGFSQTAEVFFSGELHPKSTELLKHALEAHPDHLQSRITVSRNHIRMKFQPGSLIRQSFFACLLRGEGLSLECFYQSDDSSNTPETRRAFMECGDRHRRDNKTTAFNTCTTPLDICDGQVLPVTPWGPGPTIGFAPNPPNNPEYDPFYGPFSPWINPWLGGTNYGCILDGENHTIWLRITVASPGNLEWAFLFPEYDGIEYIYMDWSLYPLTPTICSDIASNNANSAPVRCNWNDIPESPNAATGMTALASSIPILNEEDNFEVSFPVVANQQYLLLLDNYSAGNFNGGFDFSLSSTSAQVCGTVLPAGHTELAAEVRDEAIQLGWVNLNPGVYEYFEVQRAVSQNDPNASGFSTLRELSREEFYQTRHFTDHQPVPGKAFYRIRRVDANGDESFSNAAEVNYEGEGFAIFPHPVTGDRFQIWLASPAQSVKVYDASGKLVYQDFQAGLAGGSVWVNAQLAAGLYAVEAEDLKGKTSREKLLVW